MLQILTPAFNSLDTARTLPSPSPAVRSQARSAERGSNREFAGIEGAPSVHDSDHNNTRHLTVRKTFSPDQPNP
jgi:hypothetical protein